MTVKEHMLSRYSPTTLAKFASLYAGMAYGLYWIPLRALEEAGYNGLYSGMMFNVIPLILIIPLFFWRWRRIVRAPLHFHLTGIVVGSSIVLYTNAYLFTDVVRVMILFYLTPVWGFILARMFLGDIITPIRWLSILLGVGGMLTIFAVDTGLPLPRSSGDWAALVGGVLWAVASLMMLMGKESPVDYTLWFFFWNGIGAALAVMIFGDRLHADVNILALASDVLPWLIPVALILVIPASFAVIYGPTQLNPGIVGILFMVEIGIGVLSAYILTDEPFGGREVMGVMMISLAALIEPARDLLRKSATARSGS